MEIYLLFALTALPMVKISGQEQDYEWTTPWSFEENGLEVTGPTHLESAEEYDLQNYIAELNGYHYHAAIRSKNDGKLLCQGALFEPIWILTSAICMEKYKSLLDTITATLGATTLLGDDSGFIGFVRNVTEVYFYPTFDPVSGIDDLALIKIDKPVENETVKPIQLPEFEIPGDIACLYGTFDNNTLDANLVNVTEPLKCNNSELMQQRVMYYCATSEDDDVVLDRPENLGCPLVCDDRLYGVKSKGILFGSVSDESLWIGSVVNGTPITTMRTAQEELADCYDDATGVTPET